MRRAAIDIGGTFTDLVFWDDEAGKVLVHKLPSTPYDPGHAGLAGLEQLLARAEIQPQALDFLVHGTTVATNILLEKNGASVGMLTTRGFRDVLHIGRKNRPFNFSHAQDIARQSQPLIRRRHRMPISERISAPDGSVALQLDEDEVRAAVGQLRDENVEAIAICCLMSFLNPDHEKRIRDIVSEEYPGVYLSVSHEVTPLYREYERFSTTALNAYVGPKTATYVERFSTALSEKGFGAELNLMTSGGGIAPPSEARKKPVSLLLSGPVGALIAGIEVGRQVGHPSVITLDVGGTSADIGVAPNGQLRMKHLLDTKVGDYDAMMPMVDIDTIGAGGGSIAWIDGGGMFRVGPRSAGAQPGPACYGHGGTEPTTTDAMTVLGWFREQTLESSGLHIDTTLAANAVAEKVAVPLGLDLLDAAAGIYRIAVNNMVEAIRVNSVSKGFDPRDFALIAYGGAGAAFVAETAQQLSIPQVIVPPSPGVGAAAGLLSTDTRFEYRSTLWESLDVPDRARIDRVYAELRAKAKAQLANSGFASDQCKLIYLAECRYVGQGYELAVEAPPPPIDDGWIHAVKEGFHQAHEQAYLRRFEDKPIMIVNIGLVGIGAVPPLITPVLSTGNADIDPAAIVDTRDIHFVIGNRAVAHRTRFIERGKLLAGNTIDGPVVIEQTDTTTVLPPNTKAVVDTLGNLIVTFSEPAGE
ncbi:MAG: hydantoinase/oxoprolinase family protein [Gammaproteobacteria bacterium]|nr:hydantoinase/oxoprolinase family protein [Gammaproteobacteria bacterium]MDH3578107.1 hydantoinase/oxoprolinase family protein [Gammaproteobacteria bacterium]